MVEASRVLMAVRQSAERPERAERAERPEAVERPERPEAAQPTPPAPPAPPAPAEAPGVPGGAGAEIPAPGVVIINGKEFPIGGVGGGGSDAFPSTGFPFPSDIPPNVYQLAKVGIIGFTLMIVAFPIFGFLKALVNRRANTQQALPSRETTERLQRIESAVDAMSVEIERISEGQRFVTRVLAERSSVKS